MTEARKLTLMLEGIRHEIEDKCERIANCGLNSGKLEELVILIEEYKEIEQASVERS